jgi:hypothetical protein
MDNSELVQMLKEVNENLTKLNRKIDKLTNVNTKIAKCLHLIPVTEKEERELQLLQRKNLKTAADVSAQLDAMENKNDGVPPMSFVGLEIPDLFSDVLGDEYLTKLE